MIDAKYLFKLKTIFLTNATVRQDVIREANDALFHAKRAIFALHRDNRPEAEEKLKAVEKILGGLSKKYQEHGGAEDEGAFKAALEEYAEARLLYQFLTVGKIGEIKEMKIAPESYIAGLCDVPGELYRYAIKAATGRDIKMVKKCAEAGQKIVGELIEFNLTSYLRTKFDQAKQAVKKLEEVVYEVILRQ